MWTRRTVRAASDGRYGGSTAGVAGKVEVIQAYFDAEVVPHVPDAWINTAIRDHKDAEIGKIGYEINFNRYFYKYQPPRALEEIEHLRKNRDGRRGCQGRAQARAGCNGS